MRTPTPVLQIRPETPDDWNFLAHLHRSTRDDLSQLSLPDAVLEQLLAMQFHAQQTSYREHFPDAEFSIIEQNGTAIGQLIVHRGHQCIRLVYLALSPQHRRRGYGRQLLQTLQAEAQSAHLPVTLSVSPQNVAALRLYTSLGWSSIDDNGTSLEMVWPRPEATVKG